MDEARPAEIDRWVMVLLVRERGDAGRERAARGIRGQREGRVELIRKKKGVQHGGNETR